MSPSITKFPITQADGISRNPIYIKSGYGAIWMPNFSSSIGYMLMDGTYGEVPLPDTGDATFIAPSSCGRIWFVETAYNRFGVLNIQQ